MTELKQLHMQRDLRKPLPSLPPLDSACSIITAMSDGGPAAWECIIESSFERHVPFEQITRDTTCALNRVFILMCNGQPAATASVQQFTTPGMGKVHMVGTHKDFRGHGYGRLMVLTALHHMQANSILTAQLTTDDFRLPAIHTYLGLGFEPMMVDETMPARWAAVHKNLAAYSKSK
ncbi:MAG: GNAT family N-acetyltransferase [Christensenellales bacterium]|jgi:mycothiol synthase